LAVHPKDKRYQEYIGKTIEVEGLFWLSKIKVFADEMVDQKFGTGVVKITPAHDQNDFLFGKKHNLPFKSVIQLNGKLTELAGPYQGMRVKAAREQFVSDMKEKYPGFLVKIDENYTHSVTTCYKCGRDLEPTVIPNWFIKVKELKEPVIKAVNNDEIKFYPKRYKKQILQWLEVMHDWPISRQIAWGIRIPVWYLVDGNEKKIWISFIDKKGEFKKGTVQENLDQGYGLNEIKQGLQQITVPKYKPEEVEYTVSKEEPQDNRNWIQETDTFDTWFSSGQWPLVTLKDEEFKTRFPTDVMGTLSDILPFWVSRMIMFSLYRKKQIPFKDVYLWSKVVDSKGQKMSKSKGNVVNPIDMVDKYGADAFRASLVFGIGSSSNVPLTEEKVIGMRNFINKIWNIGRFIEMNLKIKNQKSKIKNESQNAKDLENLNKEFKKEKKQYIKYMDSYQFSKALGLVYEFIWHRFADYYLEQLKDEVINGNIKASEELKRVYLENLKILHPFIPFVTELVWKVFNKESILENQL
jgi:valyl-tRNA synthetase